MKLKRELLEAYPRPAEQVSNLGVLNVLSARIRDERFLKHLPERDRSKLRLAIVLKFALVAVLVIEVIALQR